MESRPIHKDPSRSYNEGSLLGVRFIAITSAKCKVEMKQKCVKKKSNKPILFQSQINKAQNEAATEGNKRLCRLVAEKLTIKNWGDESIEEMEQRIAAGNSSKTNSNTQLT
jgi:hypothetical protein